MVLRGTPFHGEFSSTNASALTETQARVTLYGAGSTVPVTLLSTDQVLVSDIAIVCSVALATTLFDGGVSVPSAGNSIFQGDFAANGGISWAGVTPHICQAGTYPKLISSGAGTISATIRGTISPAPGT